MKLITARQIADLKISPALCVDWVRESFSLKHAAQLPPKISLHPQGTDFFNTMPCLLPGRFGVKEVSRIQGAVPALSSIELLYDSVSGDLLAIMDADWITTMRTGAVAALATQTFRREGELTYGFIGLGNSARATLLCLLESEPDRFFQVCLLRYKDQAESFIERFSSYPNVSFQILNDAPSLVSSSDVIISCVTSADGLFCEDDRAFREGCTVLPVHTRGFQNCDLFFDKVFGDDTGHLHGFKYFDRFRQYGEICDVLSGKIPGRENDRERILSYNIGIGLHDLVFADKIYAMLKDDAPEWSFEKDTRKFWI